MKESLFMRWCRSSCSGGGAEVHAQEVVQESLFMRWCRSPCSRGGPGVLVQEIVQESLFRRWCRSPCSGNGAGVLVYEMVQESFLLTSTDSCFLLRHKGGRWRSVLLSWRTKLGTCRQETVRTEVNRS